MLEKNIVVTTNDGSNTLFSTKYNQHFHNIKDGAINEALSKHILPAFIYHKDKKELNILDICFGIGYNSLVTIYYILQNSFNMKLNIYSPELDFDLVKSLKDFSYPKEFDRFLYIIKELSLNQKYEDSNLKIEIAIIDAREYLKKFPKDFFDIVYQDAFSSKINVELWTKEYFDDIYKICKDDSIITTYSISSNVRLSLYEAGFLIYEIKPNERKSTLAFKKNQDKIGKYIDMELKKLRNKEAKALYDKKN